MFTENIYLLGFMGSGKTTVGKNLAAALNFSWHDLDAVIVERNEMSIRQIFATYGESFFRKEEANVLRNTALLDKMVVSCGGGTPCFHNNMRWINEHGISVFLDVDIEILTNRLLKGIEKRPLLQNKTPDELRQFIEDKLNERRSYYEKADIILHQKVEDEGVSEKIIAAIKKLKVK